MATQQKPLEHSANKVITLQASDFKNKTPVPTFRGNGSIQRYNKALLSESLAALALRKARRYALASTSINIYQIDSLRRINGKKGL